MTLSPQQLSAVQAVESSVVVLSCPGSGKTRVLVERIRHLLKSGVRADQICVVTFTSAAAHEIQERLQTEADALPPSLGYAGTLHSLLLRAIRAVPHLCGYSSPPTVASDDLSEELWQEAITETRCRESLKALRTCAALPLPTGRSLSKLESCAAHYCQKLVEAGLVDYDGILRLGLGLAQSRQLPLRFTHLLVDEVQDSGAMDAAIYQAFPASSKFFVGDEDQSIYGFRGGDPAYLRSLAKNPAVGLYKLEGCYRCSSEITTAASSVISHVPGRVDKQTISIPGPKGGITVDRFENPQGEIARIAMLISRYADGGSAPLNEVAVLLRTNALVDIYRDGLRAHGIRLKERRGEALPADWSKAQSIVALCAEPGNDRLALDYIRMLSGDTEAKRIKLLAAEQMGSIQNVCELVANTERGHLSHAVKMMVKVGIPAATIEAVQKLAEAVPDQSLSELAVAMIHERPEAEVGDGVHVGTIHSYKGREANDVYLPAFEQQVFPAKRPLDEERRLCFVAFTRARNRLHLSYCNERPSQYGSRKPEPAQPSQFIAEANLSL